MSGRIIILFILWIIHCNTTELFAEENKKKDSDALQIILKKPKKTATLEEVNSGKYFMKLQLKNVGDRPIMVWPYLSAKVFGVDEKELEPSFLIGGFGGRLGNKSIIEEFIFIKLQPSDAIKLKVRLSHFQHAPAQLIGWKLPKAGTYKIVFQYQFDRTSLKKNYGEGCKTLEKATAPWNRALELNKKHEFLLQVQ